MLPEIPQQKILVSCLLPRGILAFGSIAEKGIVWPSNVLPSALRGLRLSRPGDLTQHAGKYELVQRIDRVPV